MNQWTLLLRISAVLWLVWGLVHILAGVLTMNFILVEDISSSVGGIADAVDPATLQMAYPEAAGAVIGQHGFNLFWIGIVTAVCSVFVWRKNRNAIFLAALTGGLADLGYFLFMDLGGYVHFMPGTVMTLVSASAIILSLIAYYRSDRLKALG